MVSTLSFALLLTMMVGVCCCWALPLMDSSHLAHHREYQQHHQQPLLAHAVDDIVGSSSSSSKNNKESFNKILAGPDFTIDDMTGGFLLVEYEDGRTSIIPDGNTAFWPDATIYYEFHDSVDKSDREVVLSAIDEYHRQTCLTFVDRNGDDSIDHYVLVRSDISGCSSRVGMSLGGHQEVHLHSPGCMYVGVAMHELMHAAGFFHEHQRYDRDDYVRILYDNIEEGHEHNFVLRDLSESQNWGGATYDFGSIMHYRLDSFSANGENTIEPLDGQDVDLDNVGQRNGFSQNDLAQLNALYC